MAFSEVDRSWVRRYLGTGAIWLQALPLVENALLAVQSQAEGGSRPDSTEENFIKGVIYGVAAVTTGTDGVTPGGTTQNVVFNVPATRGLIQVENAIAFQDILLGTMEVNKIRLDSYREIIRLRSEGRRLAKLLAKALGMRRVISDVFSTSKNDEFDPPTLEELFPAANRW